MKQASQASVQLVLSFWKWETVKPKEMFIIVQIFMELIVFFGMEGHTELLLHSRLLHP